VFPSVPTFALQRHCLVKDIILNEGQKPIDLLNSVDRGIREKSKEIAHFCANVSTKKPLGPCLGLSNKVFCGPLWTTYSDQLGTKREALNSMISGVVLRKNCHRELAASSRYPARRTAPKNDYPSRGRKNSPNGTVKRWPTSEALEPNPQQFAPNFRVVDHATGTKAYHPMAGNEWT
jgi:hypothetical protein